ncbi:MAG: STAS domain-containing protein [SAR324 cluster bacterium]|nr:STAS domain-containing protein [SAR324 cluster bacterium]
MSISHSIEDDIAIVSYRGKFTGENVIELKEYVNGILEKKKTTAFLLNLDEVVKIDSSALGIIISIFKDLHGRQIGFAICQAPQMIHDILVSTRLDRIMKIFPTQTEALEEFQINPF